MVSFYQPFQKDSLILSDYNNDRGYFIHVPFWYHVALMYIFPQKQE